MTLSEAISEIIDKIKIIRADTNINEDCLKIYVEKLVLDILDYCHRKDFSLTLVFTCMDLINKRLDIEIKNLLKIKNAKHIILTII